MLLTHAYRLRGFFCELKLGFGHGGPQRSRGPLRCPFYIMHSNEIHIKMLSCASSNPKESFKISLRGFLFL